MTTRINDVSRRAFLRVAGGVVLGAASMPMLAACSAVAPSAPAAATSGGKVKLPTYIPLANLPAADMPGTPDGLLAPGYQKYPTNLIKSVSTPPGKGGDINALTVSLSPAPTPLDSNPA